MLIKELSTDYNSSKMSFSESKRRSSNKVYLYPGRLRTYWMISALAFEGGKVVKRL